jgi:predicted GNAT family acetyltransferase
MGKTARTGLLNNGSFGGATMRLISFADAAGFLAMTQAALEQQETVNSLMLGVTLRMRELPEYIESPPYLAAVLDGARLVGAAMMTPPHKLVVASGQEDAATALALIADHLLAGGWTVPGVNGPAPLSQAFAQIWQERTGRPYRVQMNLRAFELQTVIPPAWPPGQMRVANQADFELLVRWVRAFNDEALAQSPEGEDAVRKMVARALKYGNYFVWDHGGAVALAARSRPTRQGISIGPVYTPPEQRNRGYASALVAALSQRLLDEGKRFVTLFTDLANPTSNSIYQKIGFRPVSDFIEYAFGEVTR